MVICLSTINLFFSGFIKVAFFQRSQCFGEHSKYSSTSPCAQFHQNTFRLHSRGTHILQHFTTFDI